MLLMLSSAYLKSRIFCCAQKNCSISQQRGGEKAAVRKRGQGSCPELLKGIFYMTDCRATYKLGKIAMKQSFLPQGSCTF